MDNTAAAEACLTEDEILGLATGALADLPAAEAHLATCATCSALLAAAVREPPARTWGSLVGQTLGPYVLEAQIGAGGMGVVYRARDPRLGRAVALKVLHEPRWEKVFIEARAAAAIDHRAVVGIYDVGTAEGVHYVAMELVEGESLRSALAAGPLPNARAVFEALVDALVAAHARGVVHRDLKPENLVLTRAGLRILDFGLAKVDGAIRDETEPGTVQGTAGYMAPEQARGEHADARADLFAAGAIAYELFTGRRAFPGATAADRLSATLRDTPDLDPLGALAPIVGRCLAKEPRDRFQSAADLQWALRGGNRISRRGVMIGAGAAAATGLVGYLLGRRRRGARPALPKLRALTHRNGRVFDARFTRDGARVIYGAAWETDPVGVFVNDLGSGETRSLDLPQSADMLAVSAREEIAVSFDHRFVDHQSARGHLAIVPLDGGVPRPLADDVQDADFSPLGEDADKPGSSLAVVRATARGFAIELPIGTTIHEAAGWITHARVSPDGARIAYLQHPQTNDDGGSVMVVERATRIARVITGDWASLAGLAWEASGDALWFGGSRVDLINTIHRVTLGGELAEIPVPSIGRMRILDLTADRRALVTSDAWRLRAMAGDHDRSRSEVSYVSDISADGNTVAIGELGDLEAGNGAYLVPYAGGHALRLGAGFPVAISPSGTRVAANVNEAELRQLVVYSTTSADTPRIQTPSFVTYGRWIDETSLYALSHDKEIWRIAIGAAPVRILDNAGRFTLDAKHERIAFIDPDGVLKVWAHGAVTTLAKLGRAIEVCGWLASPDAIVVRTTTTPMQLERIDPVTGARSPHMTIQPPLTGLKAVDTLVLHPDGVRYAYSYGQEISQLFLMTGAG